MIRAACRNLSAWLLAGATACVEPIGPVEPVGTADMPDSTAVDLGGAAETPTIEVDTRPRNNTPPEVAQLRAAVRGLGEFGTPDRAVYARALRALADSLVVVAPPRDDRQRGIRRSAGGLTGDVLTSESDAGDVRDALEDARVVLVTGSPRADADVASYQQAVARFGAAIERIDPARSLIAQHDAVVAALEAALAALEIAVDVRD